jgi:hypothetical protein
MESARRSTKLASSGFCCPVTAISSSSFPVSQSSMLLPKNIPQVCRSFPPFGAQWFHDLRTDARRADRRSSYRLLAVHCPCFLGPYVPMSLRPCFSDPCLSTPRSQVPDSILHSFTRSPRHSFTSSLLHPLPCSPGPRFSGPCSLVPLVSCSLLFPQPPCLRHPTPVSLPHPSPFLPPPLPPASPFPAFLLPFPWSLILAFDPPPPYKFLPTPPCPFVKL